MDRIWALWQDYQGHSYMDANVMSVPTHYEGSRLDSRLTYVSRGTDFNWPDSGQFPTAREVLTYSPGFHVQYLHNEHPISGHCHNHRWFDTVTPNCNCPDECTTISTSENSTETIDFSLDPVTECQNLNTFDEPYQIEMWNQVCEEMPEATLPELYKAVAIMDCDMLGWPLNAGEEWLEEQNIDPSDPSYSCFNILEDAQ
jgi:hypothetical protein